MTDEEWSKISGEIAEDVGKHQQSTMSPWGQLPGQALEYGGAFARGALKQTAEAPGLRSILPQGIEDWAKEVDPAHPNVEGAGRYVTPANVALGFLPDAPFLAAAKTAPWLLRAASQVAQNSWKNALGGATEANTDTPSGDEAARRTGRGAVEGLGAGLGVTATQAGLRAVPRWMLPAAVAAAQAAHGGHYLWHDIRHAAAEGLAMLAARAAKLPAGLVGAAGEGAAQQGGYEPGGGEEKNPEPF